MSETLDSIYNQTYGVKNIELIISDDCSSDNTVPIIKTWLKNKTDDFYKVVILESSENKGVVKNCNQAWKNATSNWIKSIAGDDILLPNCLKDNSEIVENKDDLAVLFSLMDGFCVDASGCKIKTRVYPPLYQQRILMKSASEQLAYLSYGDLGAAPSSFINREKLQRIGYADERFKLIEDLPLWYKFAKAGYSLSFLSQKTVLYRMSGDSISNSSSFLLNETFVKDLILIDKLIIIPDLHKIKILLKIRKLLWPRLALLIIFIFGNKRNYLSKKLLSLCLLVKPNGIRRLFEK